MESLEPTLVLKLCQINKDDPKQYNYLPGHEFFISNKQSSFIDFEGKGVVLKNDLEKEPLSFGRIKLGTLFPQVYFHHKIESIKEKQFEISIETTFKSYILSNLTAANPTSLRIEKTPFFIDKGMIFDLAGTLIEVEEIQPCLKEEDAANSDFIFADVKAKSNLPADQVPTIITHRQPSPPKGEITQHINLRIIKGKDAADIGSFNFKPKKQKEDLLVNIGSHKDCEIQIEKIEPVQLIIKYDTSVKRWMVFSEVEVKGDMSAAYLYLVGANEFKREAFEKGTKVSVELRDKMKIGFGGNELEVIIKK